MRCNAAKMQIVHTKCKGTWGDDNVSDLVDAECT